MKILIIDDDEDFTYLTRSFLTRRGQDVVAANTSHEGIRLAIEEAPDLILLDLFLPKENGLQVLRELRLMEATKYIPVFILTNFDEEMFQDLSTLAGSEKYIRKQEGFDKILQLALDEKQSHSTSEI